MRAQVRGSDAEDTVALERSLFSQRRRRGAWGRWHRWILLVALVLVLGVGGWLVYASPYLRAERVEVTGLDYLSTDQVERAAAVPVRPLARVDLDAVAARVESLPPVESVVVTRAWPDAVSIEITERTAVAVVARGEGFSGIDETGLAFRRYVVRPAGLPLVLDTSGADDDARAEAAQVLSALPADLLRRVARLEVASIDAITLVLRPRGGLTQRVVWGSAEQSEDKAEVLGVLVRQRGVQVIDVSVPGRPTTRS